MRRWGALAAACLVAAVAAAVADLGVADTLEAVVVLLAVAALTAAGTAVVLRARARGHAGGLSRQLAVAVALVIGPVLVALAVMVQLMFVSAQDAVVVGIVVAFAGVAGVAAAHRLSRAIVTDVASVRDGLAAVGAGERELRLAVRAGDELSDLAAAANTMIGQLAAEEQARAGSESARRHLVAAVSHDLRTPITSLRLIAQALDDEVIDEADRQEYVRRMLTHVEVLSGLIDDLFELSRLEAGDIGWSLQRVALPDLIDETVAAMRVQGEQKGVAVTAELPSTLAAAHGNPEKLQRVLFNLIQNAIRHTPSDGSVVVRAEAVAETIEIEVADTGEGIQPSDQRLIFDAFYRRDAARAPAGAGLGLAVARAIVEAHGGRIWLADGAAPGTRVRFSVPFDRSPPLEPASPLD